MPFKHKLSRRLAALYLAAAALGVTAGCADAPTSAADEVVIRPSTLDPTLAVTTSSAIGQRISTDRYVQVFSVPSRRSKQLGKQRTGSQGTIVDGPSPITSTDPYPLFLVNFDSGVDGWVLGAYISLLAPLPPAPPPEPTVITVASVTVSPTSATVAIGATQQLTVTVRDSAGNILTGRTVMWASSNTSAATVSASGTVTGVAAGSATVTASSEGRSAAAAITVPAPTVAPPVPTSNANFASAWTTATGTSQSAFLDTSNPTPWGFVCCTSNTNSAISTASSLGLTKWPSGNAYRVGTQDGTTGIQTHVIQTDLGAPAANSHRYFRYYLQVTYGDDHGNATEGNIEHGVETAAETNAGGRGMNFYRLPRNDGTWFPAYRDIASGWRFVASGLRLAKHRTYRMEWHLSYLASTYGVEVRIYDEDGVLVATEADFFELLPVRDTSTRLGTIQFPYLPQDHRYFRVGTNGPSGNFPMANLRNDNLFLHGAVAVCSTGWCGPAAP